MSVDFTATGDGIDWGSVPAVEDLTQKTIMAWVNAQSYGHDGTLSAVVGTSKGTAGVDAAGFTFGLSNAGGANGSTTIQYRDRYDTPQTAVWHAANGAFATGAWKHIAVTYDNSSNDNDPVFYIDGTLSATTEGASPSDNRLSDSSSSFIVGNWDFTGASFNLTFDGDIEDGRVYGSILSADKIASIAAQKTFRLGAPFPVWRAKLIGATGLQTFGGTALAGGNTIIDDIDGAAGVPVSSPSANDSVLLAYQG